MTTEETLTVLESSPLRAVAPAVIERLLEASEPILVARGHCIYTTGDASDNSLCLILSGEVAIQKESQTIKTVGRGAVVGESALIRNEGQRTATVIVESESAEYVKWILAVPEFAKGQIDEILHALGGKAWEYFLEEESGV